MRIGYGSGRWLARAALCGCAALLASLDVAPAAPTVTATARIWFYRDYEPSVSLNMAPVSLNGALVGYVQADGSAFYRDVPPGHYHITVASVGQDANQAKDVDLAAGQEAFVKILSLSSWVESGDKTSYQRDTFYVSLVPAQVGRAELASHPPSGG